MRKEECESTYIDVSPLPATLSAFDRQESAIMAVSQRLESRFRMTVSIALKKTCAKVNRVIGTRLAHAEERER
jgi:hypothetical protein